MRDHRLRAARAQLVLQPPFLGALLLRLSMREDDQRSSDGSANDDIAEQWQSNVTHIAQQRPIKRIAATRAGRASPAGIALESTIGALKSQVRAEVTLLACDVALHPGRCVDAKLELGPLFSSMVYFFFCRRQSAVLP